MSNTKLSSFWKHLTYYISLVFFFIQTASCIHLFAEKGGFGPVSSWLVSFGAALLLFSFISIFKDKLIMYGKELFDRLSSLKHPWLILFVVPLAIKLITLIVFPIDVQGDIAAYYTSTAKDLANYGMVRQNVEFILTYPHLFWFGFSLFPATFIGQAYWCFSLYAAILASFSNILLFKALEKTPFIAKKTALPFAWFVALFYTYLPSFMLSHMAVTHEYGFLFLFICTIYVVFSIPDFKHQNLGWVFAGILLAMAGLVNSMGLIALIAFLCFMIFLSDASIKKRLRILLIVALFSLLAGRYSGYIQTALSDSNSSAGDNHGFWANVYLGGNFDTEGRFDYDDYMSLYNYADQRSGGEYTHSEFLEYVGELAVERWSNLLKSPLKLCAHLINKIGNIWSGTHYSIEIVLNSTFTSWQHIICYLLMIINNVIWLLFVALTVMTQFIRKTSINSEPSSINFFRTMFLGAVAIFLVVEVMNKYNLTAVLPMIIVMCFEILFFIDNKSNS